MEDRMARPLLDAVETHYEELTAFVRRKVRCPVLAADIVQEMCVRLAHGRTLPAVDNPRAFLYRVAGNLVIDHLRREQTHARYISYGPLSEDAPEPGPSAEATIDSRQRLALLMQAVEELPPRCRQVFAMRKLEGLSQAEIADALGISRNMVEKHLRKALMHCAARLKQHE